MDELNPDKFFVEEANLDVEPSEEAPPVNSKAKYRPLHSLRCYQIACNAFILDGWQRSASDDGDQRVRELKSTVLENLGAGFYSYENSEKARYYNQARAALGAIVALLSSSHIKRDQWSREISILESQVIPACSALIRKIEKKYRERP